MITFRKHQSLRLIRLVFLAVAGLASCVPAYADTAPSLETPPTVSADALPTWQINGVVWSQVLVNQTVYVIGSFSKARPPGVAAGGAGEIDAQNIFAYDIRTGNPIAGFSHSLNGQGLVVAASPDGSRIHVGGDFTAVDGYARGHLASFVTATGALDFAFAPIVGGQVRGLAVINTTVYVGGLFSSANGSVRRSLAAFNASNGVLLPWAPTVDNGKVWSMVMAPDRSRVIVGGSFTTLNGQSAYGMGSIDATTGASLPWAANQTIRDAGANGAITSLRADNSQIYGSGYAFGFGTNFEGTFAANPTTGVITVVNDCHGDTYDVLPLGPVLYSVGHAHDCTWVGSFPDTNPRVRWQRALAQTIAPTRVNTGPDNYGWNYAGLPASTILHWFPQFSTGTYTGMYQGPWSLAGNATYVAFGGEFLKVNGVAQQGLVRMAVSTSALNKRGPTYTTQPARPVPETTATSNKKGVVEVSFGTAWDYDNQTLTYEVLRNGVGTPVYTTQIASNFWTLPRANFNDSGLPDGTTLFYQVRIRDAFGNTLWSPKSNFVTVRSRRSLTPFGAEPSFPLTQTSNASYSVQPGEIGAASVDPLAQIAYRPVLRNGKVPHALIPGSMAPLRASGVVRYSDGLSIRLVEISHGIETGRGPGLFPGRPYTGFTLKVTNHSRRAVDLNRVVVTAQYGSPARAAQAIYDDEIARDFSGALAPDGSVTAAYLFAIPFDVAGAVAIVDFDAVHAPATFK